VENVRKRKEGEYVREMVEENNYMKKGIQKLEVEI